MDKLLKKIVDKTIELIIHRPKICIAAVVFALVCVGPFIKDLRSDFSYRIWFAHDDPLLGKFDSFERQFGNDENIVIIVHSKEGIFTARMIQILREVTDKMWLAPEVIRVDSLINHNFTQVDGDDLSVDPFILSDAILSKEYLQQKKDIALRDEVIPDYLIGKSAKTALIYAKMKPALDKIPVYKDTVDYARKLTEQFAGSGVEFHISGSGAINVAFEEVSAQDMERILPILFCLIILFLIFVFRSISGVVYPLVVIALSIFASFATAGLAGITFNVMISSVPTTLIAICIADVVHILMAYYIARRSGMDSDGAVRRTLEKNLVPTFLTSVTTSIGFFSLAPTKIVPVAHMGILDGFGTIYAWIISIFLIVPLLKLIPIKSKKLSKNIDHATDNYVSPMALKYVGFIRNYKWPIILVHLAIVLGSLYLALQNEVNSDPFKYFSQEVPMKIANDFMESEIGGSMGAQVVLGSGTPDGIKNPKFLKLQGEFEAWLKQKPYVSKLISISDILKSLNRSLNLGKQEFFSIAETQESVAQQLFLYTMSLPQGMDLNDRITLKNDLTRITVVMNIHDSKTVLEEFENWEQKAKSMGLEAHVTGKVPLYQQMNGYVVDTFFTSISLALLLVTGIMILVFGSFKVGLISMIPNTVPLIIGGAIMTLLGKAIDMGTVVVTSVCLGIAVDDTIHFVANFQKYRKHGDSIFDAIVKVMTFTSPALIFTTLILVVGFGTLMFGQFIPNINFGIMTAVILTVALIIDLVLLPALLLCLKEEKD